MQNCIFSSSTQTEGVNIEYESYELFAAHLPLVTKEHWKNAVQ